MFFFSIRLNVEQFEFGEPIFCNSFFVWIQFIRHFCCAPSLSLSLFRSPFLSCRIFVFWCWSCLTVLNMKTLWFGHHLVMFMKWSVSTSCHFEQHAVTTRTADPIWSARALHSGEKRCSPYNHNPLSLKQQLFSTASTHRPHRPHRPSTNLEIVVEVGNGRGHECDRRHIQRYDSRATYERHLQFTWALYAALAGFPYALTTKVRRCELYVWRNGNRKQKWGHYRDTPHT